MDDEELKKHINAMCWQWVDFIQMLLKIEDEKARDKMIKNFRSELQNLKNKEHIMNCLKKNPDH